ncbi:MAG: [protein-PII] uridylyltransferase [Granulosicoccaceae bacterium]
MAEPAHRQVDNHPVIETIIKGIQAESHSAVNCKKWLDQCDTHLQTRFDEGASGGELVVHRAEVADALVTRIWHSCVPETERDYAALVAVGGYGRGELHPHSDIDITVILPDEGPTVQDGSLQSFITALWDLGLDIGSSVRTLTQTVQAAQEDLTVMTNLLETRYLCGDAELCNSADQAINSKQCWPSYSFFRAKFEEQKNRRRQYHDSAYRLEPNVKESPGGLRDLQTIGWVVHRHFGGGQLSELSDHEFLTAEEVQTLRESRDFLWRVRFWLHRKAKRAEDRLLFEYQRPLAHDFGYSGADDNEAVEQFMQQHYRVVTEMVRLNEMLLQLFRERIVELDEPAHVESLNDRFEIINDYIAAKSDDVFSRYPPALIEIFLLGCQHADIKGIRAKTVRLIRQHLYLIDENFRHDIIVRQLFIDIFRQPHGLTHQLSRMNRFGVLAAYMPNFQSIVGRMQFDLFHIYTVDEHTLMVVRNLRQFAVEEHAESHPHCTEIMREIEHPYVLHVMGLLHDIAKGRGGDHCILGAEDTRIFAEQHGMRKSHADLAEWGVRQHLLMSTVAQRRDIYDPEVIRDFAEECKTVTRLNYLYLLTVADICGTDPALWTDWKNNLLSTLYRHTRNMIERGLDEAAATRAEYIAQRKQEATEYLELSNLESIDIGQFWDNMGEEYFARYNADEIAWHTLELAREDDFERARTLIRTNSAGSTEVAVYTRDHPLLFANITRRISLLGMNIVDARIVTTPAGFALDSFTLLDDNGEALSDAKRIEQLLAQLKLHRESPDLGHYNPPRRMRSFLQLSPTVEFNTEDAGELTSVLVTAADSPGLLSIIAGCFNECGVTLHAAKVSTFGEKAEDVFYISDDAGEAIDDAATLKKLHQTLIEKLSAE